MRRATIHPWSDFCKHTNKNRPNDSRFFQHTFFSSKCRMLPTKPYAMHAASLFLRFAFRMQGMVGNENSPLRQSNNGSGDSSISTYNSTVPGSVSVVLI